MKKIKKIFFLTLIFLLCGCSVDYKLVINTDSSVNESVTATENTNRMKSKTNLSEKQSINYLYKIYGRNNKNINSSSNNGNTIVDVFENYKSLDDYKNNFSSDIIKNVNIKENDDEITITATQSEKIDSTSSRGFIYDEINVMVIVPFIVTDNNADEVNKNTYIWHIKKDEEPKTITITYKDKKIKNAVQLEIKNKTYNIRYGIIIIILFVLFLLIGFLVILSKNRKNNRI